MYSIQLIEAVLVSNVQWLFCFIYFKNVSQSEMTFKLF